MCGYCCVARQVSRTYTVTVSSRYLTCTTTTATHHMHSHSPIQCEEVCSVIHLNTSYTRLLSHQQGLVIPALRQNFGHDSLAFHHESRLRVQHQVRFDGHCSVIALNGLQLRPRDQGHNKCRLRIRLCLSCYDGRTCTSAKLTSRSAHAHLLDPIIK